jgi:hypothetical protein
MVATLPLEYKHSPDVALSKGSSRRLVRRQPHPNLRTNAKATIMLNCEANLTL